ncbi:MAG: B12-binding domain-containing radical SAM protein [Phycisphaerae bacterium]|nr:B12-binding domain-containing radical SAM protein [Phycisphaerae bacterium]
MRIALVNPVARRDEGYHTMGSKIPHLGLQVLAKLVPPEHQVDIIDEIFGLDVTESSLRPDRYDLVGITSFTSTVTRAYEIAKMCRDRGMATVMGGPHAWACPDEAARHVDSVAVGESDEIWPQIIADAAAGRLAERYQGGLPELREGVGTAAQGLRPVNGKYDVAAIQTSRGCPVNCDYCGVTRFNGSKIRRRPMDEVLAEWNQTAKPFIFVVDDNFFGTNDKHAEWAKELCRRIIKEGKRRLWFSQTTINMGGDPEGLRLAYKAGCRGMLVGFESFSPETLEGYGKRFNKKRLDDYQKLVDGYHAAGISLFGAFVIGGDADTMDTVADTALQSVRLGVDTIQITNLTPLPGTRLYDRMLADGELTATDYPEDWERYTFTETVYKPKRMTPKELDEAIFELRHAAATEPWVWKRTLRTLLRTRSLTSALFIHGMNKGWKRMAKLQVPTDRKRFGYMLNGKNESDRMRRIRRAFKLFNGSAAT